ncbi:hypothetical protein [Pseudobacteroides cellulosolvens]
MSKIIGIVHPDNITSVKVLEIFLLILLSKKNG